MVQARFQRDNGLPEDVVINTFHFQTNNPGFVTVAEAQAASQAVQDFYKATNAPQSVSVSNFLSQVLATSGHETRVYDMGDIQPRAPIFTSIFTIVAGSGYMPSEVALCLSYRGALVSGTSPARRRGRIYLGPLTSSVPSTVDTGDARPNSQTIGVMNAAALALMGLTGLSWVVASQPDPAQAYVLTEIVTAWVDNAFDTQRRRGAAPTMRTTVNAPAV
jgi:hypothetical protein